jgi:hypothetical protein
MWVILNQEDVNDGALQRKQWIADASDKPHKLSYRPSKAYKRTCSAKEYNATNAVTYAQWLAQRDGIVIPEGTNAVPVWSTVEVAGKAKPEPRVAAVAWRKDNGRYSNGTKCLGKVLLTISIPHWDWVPRVSVEDGPMCADVSSAQWLEQFIAA